MARKDEDSFWFKFYPDKYLGGTAGFTLEMHGAYLIMLLQQNSSGPFVEDFALAIAGDVWPKIRHKFLRLDDGRFINVRMDIESQHRKEISETNRENIRKRYDRTTTVLRPKYETDTTVLRRSSSSSSSSSHESEQEGNTEKNAEFDVFWKLYPKKKSKGDAEKAWNKIKRPAETLAAIKAALEWQRTSADWVKDGGQYIPYPASYLNAKGWEDEPKTKTAPFKSGFWCKDNYIGDGKAIVLTDEDRAKYGLSPKDPELEI